uniref:C2H2-type domain-containing protein n=1 Tax=Lutzomyia longipalpis TaxID=7200 RepID=A0A1B0GKS0_LUTLO
MDIKDIKREEDEILNYGIHGGVKEEFVKEEYVITEVEENVAISELPVKEETSQGSSQSIKIQSQCARKKAREERIFQCMECLKILSSKGRLKNHLRVHMESQDIPCFVCGKTFRDEQCLKQHMKVHDEGRNYQCRTCGRCYKTQKGLQYHRNHNCRKLHRVLESTTVATAASVVGEINYQCAHCNKIFMQKPSITLHMNRHRTQLLPCSVCGKILRSRESYSVHMKDHAAKENACPVCPKVFPDRWRLKQHLIVHTRQGILEPPQCSVVESSLSQFPCGQCNQVFMRKIDLMKHLTSHDITRTYECTYCQMKFTTVSNLTNHVKTHTAKKSFPCPTCGKAFRERRGLNYHRKTHSEAQKCIHCGKEAKNRGALMVHFEKFHRGLPLEVKVGAISCTICEEIYENLEDLKEHVKIHKQLECEKCKYAFRREEDLWRHVEGYHNDSKDKIIIPVKHEMDENSNDSNTSNTS